MNKVLAGFVFGVAFVASAIVIAQIYPNMYPVSTFTSTVYAPGFDAQDGNITNVGQLGLDVAYCDADSNTSTSYSAGQISDGWINDGAVGITRYCGTFSASPADGDAVCTDIATGTDSAAGFQDYGKIVYEIQDPANGSEEGIVRFYVTQGAGALTEYIRLDGTDAITKVYASKQVSALGLDAQDQDVDNVADIALDSISPDGTNIDVNIGAGVCEVGDGTYSWGHSPMFAVEGVTEIDGILYVDSSVKVCNSYGKCSTIQVNNENNNLPGFYFGSTGAFGAQAVASVSDAGNTTVEHYASTFSARAFSGSGANAVVAQGYISYKPSVGSTRTMTSRNKSCTFSSGGGSATCTTSALILAGDQVQNIVGRVTTQGSGCTTVSVGDGSDADRYSTSISTAAGTTFTSANATAAWSHDANAAEEVTVTSTAGGNCVSTVLSITAFVITVTAPSS